MWQLARILHLAGDRGGHPTSHVLQWMGNRWEAARDFNTWTQQLMWIDRKDGKLVFTTTHKRRGYKPYTNLASKQEDGSIIHVGDADILYVGVPLTKEEKPTATFLEVVESDDRLRTSHPDVDESEAAQ